MQALTTLGLFLATALAEIVGCYLPWLWLRQGRSAWLLLPAAASLALFAWLLTLHPAAAGRVPFMGRVVSRRDAGSNERKSSGLALATAVWTAWCVLSMYAPYQGVAALRRAVKSARVLPSKGADRRCARLTW